MTELENLRKKAEKLEKEKAIADEKKQLRNKIFRLEHRGLMKTASIIERTGRGILNAAKKTGKGIIKAGNEFERSLQNKSRGKYKKIYVNDGDYLDIID